MAQYFEVLSQPDDTVDKTDQFFENNQNKEIRHIQYIFTDDSQQFQTQQVVQLGNDQIMVVDRPQQQIQNVVIDQKQISYQPADQQSFSVGEQPTQQIYFMEATGSPCNNGVQQVINQINTIPQTRQLTAPIRPNIPTIRPQQQIQTMRPVAPQQVPQIRLRAPMQHQQTQLPLRQIVPQDTLRQQPKTISMSALMNRPLQTLQSKLQSTVAIGDTARIRAQPPPTQRPVSDSNDSLFDQIRKSVSYSNSQPLDNNRSKDVTKRVGEEETDDGNSFNNSPSPLIQYKKLLEHKQQLSKSQILPRTPGTMKVPVPNTTPPAYMRNAADQAKMKEEQQDRQIQLGNNNNSKIEKFIPKVSKNPPPLSLPNRPRMQRPTTPLHQNNTARLTGGQSIGLADRYIGNHQHKIANQSMLQQQRMLQSENRNPTLLTQRQQPSVLLAQQQQPPPVQKMTNESQIKYLITPPAPNKPKQPLPSFIHSRHIQKIIDMFKESTTCQDEFSDSIRMLVLLENGEQRLITFTLPREACTIQEVLEQVNVSFTSETNIQVIEVNTPYINYIVTVGNVTQLSACANEDDSQELIDNNDGQQSSIDNDESRKSIHDQSSEENNLQSESNKQNSTISEPPKEQPKLIPGKLAVCLYCGYTGEDFNRCRRCNRKLADNVRSIDTAAKKISLFKNSSDSPTSSAVNISRLSASLHSLSRPLPTSGNGIIGKKKMIKSKVFEQESVVISSDEEDEDITSAKSVTDNLLKSLGASVTISPITKEPTINDIKKHVRKVLITPDSLKPIKFNVQCRTVRVGSYRCVPVSDIFIDSRGVLIKIPLMDSKTDYKLIKIDQCDIVKVLVCFNKVLPVIFYYLSGAASPYICESLNLKKENSVYFDPLDEKEESYRRITLLPYNLSDDVKTMFQQVYNNLFEELNAKEANDILIKSCPREMHGNSGSLDDIKQILLYPKEGQGRLSINTEDYVCLAMDQFLNDKIIDFYLKYLWENLPSEKQEKVHIFSTFFYKRLTTKPTKAARKSHPFETDPCLSAAEKRHCRVKNWTKRINLFAKDFIIVPINENAHWFLAIICFPGMAGPQTFDGKTYNPEPKPKKSTKHKAKKEKPIPCDDPLLSDKDEADSEESDMESDDSEESGAASSTSSLSITSLTPLQVTKGKKEARPPIKQPCILIFDSLAGPSRSRVVATLRDYLTVEYKTKMESDKLYTRDIIKGASVKVPQQTNFTDCGLYLLQYVEQFFTESIKDYHIPLKGIEQWFSEITVTKKREDICNLIKKLMVEAGHDTNGLPDILLPTMNGNLIDRPDYEPEQDGEPTEDPEDMFTDIEDSELLDTSATSPSADEKFDKIEESENESSPTKTDSNDINKTAPTDMVKHAFGDFPRQTNKDTLSYLKSKRIVRTRPKTDTDLDIKKPRYE